MALSNIYALDPLSDPRWATLVQEHPNASIFHTVGWLGALKRTYGYEPVVFTTSRPGVALANGLVFCRIDTWPYGRRLVSLPFSDHCTPLVTDIEDWSHLLVGLQQNCMSERRRYIEIRSSHLYSPESVVFRKAGLFWSHKLDLRPDLSALFRGFHKDCIQRKIQRAAREDLICSEGTSDALLDQFYRLLLVTRLRHRVPPQPTHWFRNLIDCLGGNITIRIASKDDRPIAGMLCLTHKRVLVYKYGVSDHKFNNLGGTQLLLWKTIQDAKRDGFQDLDMGRCDRGNSGLAIFKQRWAAVQFPLSYWRYPPRNLQASRSFAMRLGREMLALMPGGLLSAVGRRFYKHAG